MFIKVSKNLTSEILNAFILLILVSDFSLIDGNNLSRVSILVSFFFIRDFKLFFRIILILSPLIIFSSIGILSSLDLGLSSLIYPMFLLPSASQGVAIFNIIFPINNKSFGLNPSSENIIKIFFILLLLIGIIQSLNTNRPPLVFYECNYLGYWLAPMFVLKSLNNNEKKDTFFYFIICIGFLAITKSLTVFGILLIWNLVDFSKIVLNNLRIFFTKFKLYKISLSSLFINVSFLLIIFFLLLYFSKSYEYLLIRVKLIALNPSKLLPLSGCRYPQFIAAKDIFDNLPLVNQLFGGRFADLRSTNVLCEGNNYTIPATGIFALLSQYGFFGVSYFSFLIFRYGLKLNNLVYRKNYIIGNLSIENYLIILTILICFLFTNITYSIPVVFLIILYYRLLKLLS